MPYATKALRNAWYQRNKKLRLYQETRNEESTVSLPVSSGSDSEESEEEETSEETTAEETTAVETTAVETTAVEKPPPVENLEAQLFDYMCDHQITRSSMRSLLSILNSHAELFPLQKLPKDPQTLMRRQQPTRNLIMRQTKEFAYNGVRNSLVLLYERNKNAFDGAATIKLAFNVDGLPTSKSSSAEVWPILMSTDIARDYVHVIAVYYGAKKPSANVLLCDFITELGPLLENAFKYKMVPKSYRKT